VVLPAFGNSSLGVREPLIWLDSVDVTGGDPGAFEKKDEED
jgi:hypothetical protein